MTRTADDYRAAFVAEQQREYPVAFEDRCGFERQPLEAFL